MLQLRIYAFYGKKKNILILLICAFCLTSGTMIGVMGKVLDIMDGEPIYQDHSKSRKTSNIVWQRLSLIMARDRTCICAFL